MDTRVVTAHVSLELAKQVDAIAARLERPKGWIVKEALASYVALDEKRHRLTLEALAAVDAGQVVPHAEIKAWADSLKTTK
ncbi:MAG: CopG family ribbon-helix-helix protein [Rickettsiales bacterium]